eukprot:6208433-Pleurochrysis_carterae.AAC.8
MAVSRARMSASMAGPGSSRRTLFPLFEFCGATAVDRLGETLSYGSRVVRVDVVARMERVVRVRRLADAAYALNLSGRLNAVHDSSVGQHKRACGSNVRARRVRRIEVTRRCTGDFTPSLHKERAERGVRHGRRLRTGFRGFGGGECRSRLVVAAILFRRRLVGFGTTFGAVLVPVGPFAPAAGGPLVAPLLSGFRARALWISRLAPVVFAAVFFAAYSEGMRRAGVRLKFAAHVAGFGVAQDTAGSVDGEAEIAHTRVER